MNAQQIIDRAATMGSTATTMRGAARWLVSHRAPVKPAPLPGDWWTVFVAPDPAWAINPWMRYGLACQITRAGPGKDWQPTARRPATGATTRDAWRDLATRKYDRDARRAADDARFRRGWSRRLIREANALLHPPVRTLAEVTQAADSHQRRSDRLGWIRQSLARGKSRATIPECPDLRTLPGRILNVTPDQARRAGASIDMRGKDATIAGTLRSSFGVHSGGVTEWNHGAPVGYTRATHDNYVRSFALARDRDLHIALHTRERALRVPEGWRWDADDLGVRIVRGSDDYHPGSIHGLRQSDVDAVIQGWDAMLAQRAEACAKGDHEAIMRRDLRTTRVTLDDSRRAGNCVEGSLRFAELRLGMSRDDIIAGSWLVSVSADRLMRTGEPRAVTAARAAWQRETLVSI